MIDPNRYADLLRSIGVDAAGLPMEADAVLMVRPVSDVMYIYALVDPRIPRIVRYVGMTASPPARYVAHIQSSRFPWARNLFDEGFPPIMLQLEVLEPGDFAIPTLRSLAQEREAWWMDYFKQKGQADLNGGVVQHLLRKAIARLVLP